MISFNITLRLGTPSLCCSLAFPIHHPLSTFPIPFRFSLGHTKSAPITSVSSCQPFHFDFRFSSLDILTPSNIHRFASTYPKTINAADASIATSVLLSKSVHFALVAKVHAPAAPTQPCPSITMGSPPWAPTVTLTLPSP